MPPDIAIVPEVSSVLRPLMSSNAPLDPCAVPLAMTMDPDDPLKDDPVCNDNVPLSFSALPDIIATSPLDMTPPADETVTEPATAPAPDDTSTLPPILDPLPARMFTPPAVSTLFPEVMLMEPLALSTVVPVAKETKPLPILSSALEMST
jgi:hypothetical protein